MFKRILRLINVVLILAIVLYIVLLNREPFQIYLSPSESITTQSGLALVVTFFFGLLAASCVGAVFGFQWYLRERHFQGKESQHRLTEKQWSKARGFRAAGELEKSQAEFKRLIAKNPNDILARIDLSGVVEQLGDAQEALKIIDATRAIDPNNIEVLFRAAELNCALGNRTAAIDNLALILASHPNRRAASMARDLAEQLGRIDEALEFHQKLLSLGQDDKREKTIRQRLEYRRLLRQFEHDPAALREQLGQFVRRSEGVPEAAERFAELSERNGEIDTAAQWYVRAARESGNTSLWHKASALWLRQNKPQSSLAAARAATKESSGAARIAAEIELIRVYVGLSMFEEARQAAESLPEVARSAGVTMSQSERQENNSLLALALLKLGESQRATEVLRTMSSEESPSLPREPLFSTEGKRGEAPAPRLSTP